MTPPHDWHRISDALNWILAYGGLLIVAGMNMWGKVTPWHYYAFIAVFFLILATHSA